MPFSRYNPAEQFPNFGAAYLCYVARPMDNQGPESKVSFLSRARCHLKALHSDKHHGKRCWRGGSREIANLHFHRANLPVGAFPGPLSYL